MSKYALNRTTIVLITSQPSFVLGMLMVVAPTGHALNSVSFASPSAKRENASILIIVKSILLERTANYYVPGS